MERRHVLVVPGHRDGGHAGGEHLITKQCLLRVRAAERLAARRPGIVAVVFAGAGAPGHPSEARQMADAWRGPEVPLICEEDSVDTAYNAACALLVAQALRATHVTVVSSCWHLRLPLYYLPYRRHGIKIGFWGAIDLEGLGARLAHELRYTKLVPRARREAYRDARLAVTTLPDWVADGAAAPTR